MPKIEMMKNDTAEAIFPEPVKCAVVGLGRIASTLEKDILREKPCTHIGAIVHNTECSLVAVCDVDPQARSAFQEDWSVLDPQPAVYDSVDRLLENTVPDLLVVATPPETHRFIVQKAARSGVPVVLCEKPLAHTLREARRIAKVHRCGLRKRDRNHGNGKTKVAVNHERRYAEDYRLVKRFIEEGEYGKLLSIKGTLYFGRNRKHNDMLLHDGTHMVDAVNFLTGGRACVKRKIGPMGPMRTARGSVFIYGKVNCVDREASGDVVGPREGNTSRNTFRRPESGVPVVIEVGSQRDHLVFELELSFERGRVRIGNGVLTFERSEKSSYYENYRSLIPDETKNTTFEKTGYFANMLADMVQCVKDPSRNPVSSAEDGLAVMEFIRLAGADGGCSANRKA